MSSSPTGVKGLIDIEVKMLNRVFGVICLEENRTKENVRNYEKTASSLIRLLNQSVEEIKQCIC